jgi:von Willebrand factor type A domain
VRTSHLFATASMLAVVLQACGGASSSVFGSGGDSNGSDAPPTGGSASNPTGINLGDAGGGVGASCAESTSQAALVPVILVFMIDRSGSMSQDMKWPTVVSGLESFFADPASAGISASVQFFENDQDECDVSAYQTPAVAITSLPSTIFASTINTYSPNGGTPTEPALGGAIAYAQQQQAANPGTKVAVVLATDGVPNDCNSTVDNVAAEAQAVASTIPTYVIGVGDQLQSLDQIAMGGGTMQAFVVSVGNPAQTATDFQTALSTIRGNTLSCELQLPMPPAGKTLDPTTVNVLFTPSGGSAMTLTYDQNCAGTNDWHYDNPASPTEIILCQSTCATVQADSSAKIDIVTGCVTNGVVPM